jgi:hypothetical protein
MKAKRFFSITTLLLSAVLGSSMMLTSPSAQAIAAGGGVLQGKGFDACSAPSTGAMSAWWNNTPWSFIGVYIGGSARGCSQPNLTPSWFNTTNAQGWRYELIWVGPQAPCTAFASRMSYDVNTAYQQGKNEANSAWIALKNLGFGTAAGTPVVYDLENYPNNSACRAAVKSFMQGWVDQLATPPYPQPAGVYGSACGSYLADLATIARPPKYIVPADWDGNPSTTAMACINGSSWANHQRIKQFQGGHNETWGGVTINIDSNCANGPVAPNGANYTTACN